MKSRDSKRWLDYDGSHDFDWFNWDHRVKPKPMVIWVNVYSDGDLYAHKKECSADEKAHSNTALSVKTVKFIEVIE